jgi:large subunit ribosomal protein L25
MDRLPLDAKERIIIGKKVKHLRKEGQLPAHVFGKGLEAESVSVDGKVFLKTFKEAGATGVIDLKIGAEKIRPVMVRDIQYDPISGDPIHIDFYQVNLSVKVTVPVPLVLVGEDPESVKLGENIVLQTVNEVQVEALPTDLVENIEIDITALKNVDDAISVGELKYDREKLNVLADPEEIVVKLAPAVSAEMEALLEEQAAETEAAAAEAATEEGAEGEEKVEGEEGVEEGEGAEGVGEIQGGAEENPPAGGEGGGNDQGGKG